MPKIDVFFDSSALIAGIVSSLGAARALLLLAEDEKILITVSEQVIAEVERNIARKAPKALPFTRELILNTNIRIVRDPPADEVLVCQDWIEHPADVPILVAASRARVDFLATLNTKHFIDDREVAQRSGLRIGTPGDALNWVRLQLSGKTE
ncbi:MAG: PIN domain-containing protein [Anaerolineaceae bacterium]|nr:PIN domain-containing protein [Anaerolineaceae bacterium]